MVVKNFITGHRRRRQADILFLLLLGLIPFAFPGALLFKHPALPGGDLGHFFQNHVRVFADGFRLGIVPLWNPYHLAGIPAFGSGLAAPFYPPYFGPLFLFDITLAMKVRLLLHLSLSGMAFYALLRHFFVSPWLALLGAATYLLSGHTMTKAFLVPIGDAAMWAPLLLLLNLRFVRRPNLARGLLLAAGGGAALLLFVPQVVLTLCLLLSLLAACHFLKLTARSAPRPARWVDLLLLPILELSTLALFLRYPDSGWKNAVTGLGRDGLALLLSVVVVWGVWLAMRRLRVRVAWRAFGQWALRYAAVWALAGALAAPQLAITLEIIPETNQSQLAYTVEDFFTGAQAWGCVQNFVLSSARVTQKEVVNNMALGPVVFLLIAAGLAGGFHRRRRHTLTFFIGILIVGAVYFALPGMVETLVHLPFFKKFKGLSRYLVFLNFFMVLFAILSAQMWLRRLPALLRRPAVAATILLLLANLALLVHHDDTFFRRVFGNVQSHDQGVIRRLVSDNLDSQERFLLDARGEERTIANLTVGLAISHSGIPMYDPMRLATYDTFLKAHNDHFGVDLWDYRMPLFEPEPSAWTRALRVRGFLFPAEREPSERARKILQRRQRIGGWTLWVDPEVLPIAWPETNLERTPPEPVVPDGWSATGEWASPHRLNLRVQNPGAETWLVLPTPQFPGWRAWVNNEPVRGSTAYGFLQAIRIGPGASEVRVEYRAIGFAAGWVCFIWGLWCLAALGVVAARNRKRPLAFSRDMLFLCALGALPASVVAIRVFTAVPDSVFERATEMAGVSVAALACGHFISQRLRRRRRDVL